jgi:hypothetical protein
LRPNAGPGAGAVGGNGFGAEDGGGDEAERAAVEHEYVAGLHAFEKRLFELAEIPAADFYRDHALGGDRADVLKIVAGGSGARMGEVALGIDDDLAEGVAIGAFEGDAAAV